MTPQPGASRAIAFSGNLAALREFITEHYKGNPPTLVWVAGIPSEEGGGVRYEYGDGSYVDAYGARYSWHDPDVWTEHHSGSWDPIR